MQIDVTLLMERTWQKNIWGANWAGCVRRVLADLTEPPVPGRIAVCPLLQQIRRGLFLPSDKAAKVINLLG